MMICDACAAEIRAGAETHLYPFFHVFGWKHVCPECDTIINSAAVDGQYELKSFGWRCGVRALLAHLREKSAAKPSAQGQGLFSEVFDALASTRLSIHDCLRCKNTGHVDVVVRRRFLRAPLTESMPCGACAIYDLIQLRKEKR